MHTWVCSMYDKRNPLTLICCFFFSLLILLLYLKSLFYELAKKHFNLFPFEPCSLLKLFDFHLFSFIIPNSFLLLANFFFIFFSWHKLFLLFVCFSGRSNDVWKFYKWSIVRCFVQSTPASEPDGCSVCLHRACCCCVDEDSWPLGFAF